MIISPKQLKYKDNKIKFNKSQIKFPTRQHGKFENKNYQYYEKQNFQRSRFLKRNCITSEKCITSKNA